MQEADLTGCSSDSANDEEQHEGNVTLRGILQSSTSSLPPLLHPPSLPEESVLFKPISSAQFPLLTSALLPRLPNHRQVGCKFTYKARRADGGSHMRHLHHICLSDEERFLSSCIHVQKGVLAGEEQESPADCTFVVNFS